MNREEEISFRIIANCGEATSCYVEAMGLAREGKIDEARAMVEQGQKASIEGHKAHMELLTAEANGEKTNVGLLLIHAEDQLNKCEILEIMANQKIEDCANK